MKHVLMLLIRVYRRCISPLFPPCCRYYPTCSQYALTAVERFGAAKGSVLAALRLLRCHPWAPGGVDEVPEEISWKRINYYRMRQNRQNPSEERDR